MPLGSSSSTPTLPGWLVFLQHRLLLPFKAVTPRQVERKPWLLGSNDFSGSLYIRPPSSQERLTEASGSAGTSPSSQEALGMRKKGRSQCSREKERAPPPPREGKTGGGRKGRPAAAPPQAGTEGGLGAGPERESRSPGAGKNPPAKRGGACAKWGGVQVSRRMGGVSEGGWLLVARGRGAR